MEYMLLINVPDSPTPPTEEESNAMQAEFAKYSQDLRDSGALLAGDRLQPPAAATTVRIRDGETLTTDGPFAETKEVLGGFYLYEADDLDSALEVAARIPAARMGGVVEVRPLVER